MPLLAKYQPCGCVICTCGDDERCHGCGAKNCGTHLPTEIPNPVYEPDPEQHEYFLENGDGTERVPVPKWLYDHVVSLESRLKDAQLLRVVLNG